MGNFLLFDLYCFTMFEILLILIFSGSQTASGDCPFGWFTVTEDDYCYHVSEERFNFGQSQEYCWGLGGYLAEFDSLEEEEAVHSMLNQDGFYWIGLTDLSSEGTRRWQETHQEPSYTNWAPGQPDNEFNIEDCVCITGEFVRSGGWHDVFCDTDNYGLSLHALCKKEKVEATTTGTTTTTPTNMPTTTTTATDCSGYEISLCGDAYDYQSETEGIYCNDDTNQYYKSKNSLYLYIDNFSAWRVGPDPNEQFGRLITDPYDGVGSGPDDSSLDWFYNTSSEDG